MVGSTKSKGFSYRPKNEHAPVLADLMEAVGLKKAAILDAALADKLPLLEKEYAPQLARLREKRAAESIGWKLNQAMKLTIICLLLSSLSLVAQTNQAFQLVIHTNLVTAPVYIREVDGKIYDIRYSQLWKPIGGKIVKKLNDGVTLQTYVTNNEYAYGERQGNYDQQHSGAYSAGSTAPRRYLVSSEVVPDKKIILKHYMIGEVGQTASVRAMMIEAGDDAELWDCGLPHQAIVISTNKVALKP
jgi:hypothetical protein